MSLIGARDTGLPYSSQCFFSYNCRDCSISTPVLGCWRRDSIRSGSCGPNTRSWKRSWRMPRTVSCWTPTSGLENVSVLFVKIKKIIAVLFTYTICHFVHSFQSLCTLDSYRPREKYSIYTTVHISHAFINCTSVMLYRASRRETIIFTMHLAQRRLPGDIN